MPDTKNSTQGSARLAALKTALMDERQVLGLDPGTARARTDALLGESHGEPSGEAFGESMGEVLPASSPDAALSREQAWR